MSQRHPPFEVLEHTADAGIIARGSNPEELFSNAALGMFSLMVDTDGVRETEERFISVGAHDLETLLVHWLSELLYHVDAEEMIFSRFEILELWQAQQSAETPETPPEHDERPLYRLRGRALGERIDPERHSLRTGVKAVTRHMLDIRAENSGYRATVLFDL